MDGDQRDIVLDPGQTLTIERNGRTLLHAEAPSTVRISAPPAGGSGHFSWNSVRRALAASIQEKYAQPAVPYY